jgi:hypothetical protein
MNKRNEIGNGCDVLHFLVFFANSMNKTFLHVSSEIIRFSGK